MSVGEGSNHAAPANKTCSVTVTLPTKTLNSNSWATVKEASDAGTGANYWAVGDTKSITLNGAVQGFTFSNVTVNAFIIGFNHNATREGGNRIHFLIGKISGKDVALCDSKYHNSGSDAGFRMNQSKGYIKPGVYTIVEEATGKGATKWGKLKSGAGWISLDYAKRL